MALPVVRRAHTGLVWGLQREYERRVRQKSERVESLTVEVGRFPSIGFTRKFRLQPDGKNFSLLFMKSETSGISEIPLMS